MYDRRWLLLITALVVALAVTATMAVRHRSLGQRLADRVDQLQQSTDDAPGRWGIADTVVALIVQLLQSASDRLGGDDEALSAGGVDDIDLSGCPPPERDTLPDGGEDIDGIAATVEHLRGLSFTELVDAASLDDDEIAAAVRDNLERHYPREQADIDARLLTALGAVPAGTDLLALAQTVLDEQLAGFYDSETKMLAVRAEPGEALDPPRRIAMAHELAHALADQVLGLPDEQADSDAALAAAAVVEGDATLVMQHYAATTLGARDLLSLLTAPGSDAQLDAVPDYLQRELLFPYVAGLQLVCGLHGEGGWAAVDDAYRTPPATTAEVLFPDRLAQHVDPRDPRPLPAPWQTVRSDTFGAAQLLWLTQAPGGDPARAVGDPLAAAAAWAGGEVTVSTRGDATAVTLALAQRVDAVGLCQAVHDWYAAAFPDSEAAPSRDGGHTAYASTTQHAVVACAAQDVRVGIAPDAATAAAAATR